MGATFDQALLREAGELMGRETIAKGAHVLLGPCINMQRSPMGGRGFESLSEDPVVAGLGAAAIIEGIEGTGVASCIKHFVCNDQEHQRTLYNAIVTDRALREIYLKPFQIATRDAKPATYMTAYNKVNGLHASENPILLKKILREEWGWEGLVMSDWHGTYSTTEAVEAGLDLEMPGPSRWRKTILSHALSSGKLSPLTLDDRARAVLRLVDRCAASKVPENAPEGKLDTPETAAFLRRIASESLVLLKNSHGVLPLKKNQPTLIVGPNVQAAVYCGGGSSSLPAYYTVSPWEGVKSKMAPGTPLSHAVGAYTHKELPLIGPHLINEVGKPGFDMKVYNEPPNTKGRELAEHMQLTNTNIFLMDFKSPRVTSPLWYGTITGSFTPPTSGNYDFGLCVYGTANLYINDELVIENSTNQKQGTVFYGAGTIEEKAHIPLTAGTAYSVRVEFASAPTNTLRGGGIVRFGGGAVRIGCARQIDAEEELASAVAAAKQVDQVIVVATLGPDWETEGHDRTNMKLPGLTDRLIVAVAEANKNTVVVLQTGTPVEMPWVDKVSAVVQAWYGGNETGNAIADVLFGDVNPSGKLSLSFPKRMEDNPAYLNYASEAGRTLYGEDVYIGYRYYEAVRREVLFPFGHGLSYTTFGLSGLSVTKNDQDVVTVVVTLQNTGKIAGAEVVQVYVAPCSPSIRRAPKELQGFAKEFLQPGEKRNVEISMPLKYASAYWDESRDMWKCEKDRYRVLAGTSSQGPFVEADFEVDNTFWWKGL